MNHRLNAIVNNEPRCAECGAAARMACRTPQGNVREPHAVRVAERSGDVVIIYVEEARRARVLGMIRRAVQTIRRTR